MENKDNKNTEHHHDIFHNDFLDKHPEIKKHEMLIMWILVAVLLIFLCIAITLNFSKDSVIDENNGVISALNTQLENEISNRSSLQAKVDELDGKVLTLSETVSTKTNEANNASEELRLLKLPSGYPIKGTSTIILQDDNNEDQNAEDEDTVDNNENIEENAKEESVSEDVITDIDESVIDMDYKDKQYIMFMTGSDTTVVATGLGKVIAITQDSDFGYAIKVDHENGYYSIYRGYGVPLVSTGDYVSRGCVLMSIADNQKYFLYQIIFEGNYLDPMEIMEING